MHVHSIKRFPSFGTCRTTSRTGTGTFTIQSESVENTPCCRSRVTENILKKSLL